MAPRGDGKTCVPRPADNAPLSRLDPTVESGGSTTVAEPPGPTTGTARAKLLPSLYLSTLHAMMFDLRKTRHQASTRT